MRTGCTILLKKEKDSSLPYPVTRFHYVWWKPHVKHCSYFFPRSTCTCSEDTVVTCALTDNSHVPLLHRVWSQWKCTQWPMAWMWKATPLAERGVFFLRNSGSTGFALFLKFHAYLRIMLLLNHDKGVLSALTNSRTVWNLCGKWRAIIKSVQRVCSGN